MSTFPYSYYRCPCADNPLPDPAVIADDDRHGSSNTEKEENPFNPYDARSNFSLYPLEHLMWCESCHEIRCPRCIIEEIVCWFCPGCGFEVASSMVKSEGNRCTRNCYNCPSCTAGLFVNSLDTEGAAAPWILVCEHCDWTSLDIGITFEKPNNIHGQLAKILGKTRSKVMRLLDDSPGERALNESVTPLKSDPDARFGQLMAFYRSEMNKENPSNNPFMNSLGGTPDYNSPGKFARIMNLYTNTGSYGKKANPKTQPMRGAEEASEGLSVVDREADEATIERIRKEGLLSLTNTEQRMNQPHNPRFQSEMLPQAMLLSTKTSRRCRACRHILVKPEAKVSSTRYRIKLIALTHIPSLTIRPLPTGTPSPQPTQPASASTSTFPWTSLPPNRPLQLLLTLTNPLFEEVRITLATPSTTPGRFGHKVTILCPQFTLGANADVWDEALGLNSSNNNSNNNGGKDSTTIDPLRRQSTLVPIPKSGTSSLKAEEESRIAEAGKIWERGRNWTSVVLEIICQSVDVGANSNSGAEAGEDLGEDEDTLQIPLFVRLEYEQPVSGSDNSAAAAAAAGAAGSLAAASRAIGGDKDDDRGMDTTTTAAAAAAAAAETGKVKRELAYWVVLGAGRVAQASSGQA